MEVNSVDPDHMTTILVCCVFYCLNIVLWLVQELCKVQVNGRADIGTLLDNTLLWKAPILNSKSATNIIMNIHVSDMQHFHFAVNMLSICAEILNFAIYRTSKQPKREGTSAWNLLSYFSCKTQFNSSSNIALAS